MIWLPKFIQTIDIKLFYYLIIKIITQSTNKMWIKIKNNLTFNQKYLYWINFKKMKIISILNIIYYMFHHMKDLFILILIIKLLETRRKVKISKLAFLMNKYDKSFQFIIINI